MWIELPKAVKQILDMLDKCGYEAYIVGGCVRDSIMGIVPHDWDICTSALPEQIIEVFKDYRTIPTGIKHGTVTVIVDDEQYEITTYRIDGEYKDNRHPDEVEFTSDLLADLARRDFTINAMAYNPKTRLVDEYGGMLDIQRNIIRCVGDAEQRFTEDALRIMRAMRFAIRFGFLIEMKTIVAMMKCKSLLHNISAERINSELVNMLSEKGKEVSFTFGYMYKILEELFPELKDKVCDGEWIVRFRKTDNLIARLALFFDLPEWKQRETLTNLRFDNRTLASIISVSSYGEGLYYNLCCEPGIVHSGKTCRYMAKVLLRDTGYDNAIATLEYIKARIPKNISVPTIEERSIFDVIYENVCDVYEKQECYELSSLAVNGYDVMNFGYSGQQVKAVLNYLLEMVMKGLLKNDKDTLVKRIGELGKIDAV